MTEKYEFIDAEYASPPVNAGLGSCHRADVPSGSMYRNPDSMNGGPGREARPRKDASC